MTCAAIWRASPRKRGPCRLDGTLAAILRTMRVVRLTAIGGPGAMLWRIVLPAASPYIITGLRVALSIALILVTTAEMVAGSKGLGFFILDEERSMNSSNMYAGVLIVAALGYTLNRLFLAIEARVMRWQHGMFNRETG